MLIYIHPWISVVLLKHRPQIFSYLWNLISLKVIFFRMISLAHKYPFLLLSLYNYVTKRSLDSSPSIQETGWQQLNPKGKYHQLLFRANLTDNLTSNQQWSGVNKFQSNEKWKNWEIIQFISNPTTVFSFLAQSMNQQRLAFQTWSWG